MEWTGLDCFRECFFCKQWWIFELIAPAKRSYVPVSWARTPCCLVSGYQCFCILPFSGLLRVVWVLEADVSGLLTGSTFKGQHSWTFWPVKMGPIGSPETLVSNHVTPRINPEDGGIQFNPGASLRSCSVSVVSATFVFMDWQACQSVHSASI